MCFWLQQFSLTLTENSFFKFTYLFFFCVCVQCFCLFTLWHACGGQMMTCGSQFSHSNKFWALNSGHQTWQQVPGPTETGDILLTRQVHLKITNINYYYCCCCCWVCSCVCACVCLCTHMHIMIHVRVTKDNLVEGVGFLLQFPFILYGLQQGELRFPVLTALPDPKISLETETFVLFGGHSSQPLCTLSAQYRIWQLESFKEVHNAKS